MNRMRGVIRLRLATGTSKGSIRSYYGGGAQTARWETIRLARRTRLTYNSSDIDVIIKDLDGDPERQDRIRRTGIVQALTRHDWVYRWEAILKAAGLEPMQGVLERKERLRKLAEVVSKNGRAWGSFADGAAEHVGDAARVGSGI